ncbi:MAG: hypothetical protein WBB43_14525 [Limnoraphis sp.]
MTEFNRKMKTIVEIQKLKAWVEIKIEADFFKIRAILELDYDEDGDLIGTCVSYDDKAYVFVLKNQTEHPTLQRLPMSKKNEK